jgi:hypothetical protein
LENRLLGSRLPAMPPPSFAAAATAPGSAGATSNSKTLAIETRNDIDVNRNVIDVISLATAI